MTVRLDSELLSGLKELALKTGRSVSAEVTQMIKQEVAPREARPKVLPKSEGMFSQFEAPTLEELRNLRSVYSKNIGALSP